jgi:hypothetical protein
VQADKSSRRLDQLELVETSMNIVSIMVLYFYCVSNLSMRSNDESRFLSTLSTRINLCLTCRVPLLHFQALVHISENESICEISYKVVDF